LHLIADIPPATPGCLDGAPNARIWTARVVTGIERGDADEPTRLAGEAPTCAAFDFVAAERHSTASGGRASPPARVPVSRICGGSTARASCIARRQAGPGLLPAASTHGGRAAAAGGGHRLQTVPRADRRRTRVRCRPGSCPGGVDLAWVRSC